MPFQITCPNGHLLLAEPQQAGQQCQCPTCGIMFLIPAPPAQAAPMAMPAAPSPVPMATAPAAFPPTAAPAPPGAAPDVFPPAAGPPDVEPAPSDADRAASAFEPAADISFGPRFPDVSTPGAAGKVAFDPTGQVAGPQMLHIPCPDGHMLETPPEMVGEEVICPHCGRQFTLREKDSVEHKRKKKEERERRDIRAGKRWFTWAVVICAVVVIGLILMIALGQW
jgi:hypothetical protein